MMMLAHKLILSLFGIFLTTLIVGQEASAASYRCNEEVDKIVKNLDLSGKTVKKTEIVGVYEGEVGGSTISTIEGWITFAECKGNLVVRMDLSCQLDTIYTQGDCLIDGVENY